MSPGDFQVSNDLYQEEQVLQEQTPFASFFLKLFGAGDPEREKKRLLKEIAKKLRKEGLKFYSHRNDTADPALAKFFYNFYRTLGPAHAILHSAGTLNALQSMIITLTLTRGQLRIKDNLSEEAVRARAKTTETSKLAEELKNELKKFSAAFDGAKIKQIEHECKMLHVLLDLINFDYFFLLKKLDSKILEDDYLYTPRFEAVNGKYIVDNLKDFLEIIPALDPKTNWGPILDMLKEYRQVEVISHNEWNKLLQAIMKVQRSKVLEMVVQLIDKDPFYEPKPGMYGKKVVEEYLSNIKSEVEFIAQKIVQEKREVKIESLASFAVGTSSISRLSNYTETANMRFSKKNLTGYIYITALNYLKAFLLDFIKKDVKEVVNFLVIKGIWSTNATSRVLSDAYQQLRQISDALLKFDSSLGEGEELGRKVKTAVFLVGRSKKDYNSLREIIMNINHTAKDLIYRGVENCIALGKVLKLILEDYYKKHPELIINWKELNTVAEDNIKAKIIGVYKKLYCFVQLLRLLK